MLGALGSFLQWIAVVCSWSFVEVLSSLAVLAFCSGVQWCAAEFCGAVDLSGCLSLCLEQSWSFLQWSAAVFSWGFAEQLRLCASCGDVDFSGCLSLERSSSFCSGVQLNFVALLTSLALSASAWSAHQSSVVECSSVQLELCCAAGTLYSSGVHAASCGDVDFSGCLSLERAFRSFLQWSAAVFSWGFAEQQRLCAAVVCSCILWRC